MTITKKLRITDHALMRYRRRVDPFVSENTVVKAVGRAQRLSAAEVKERGLIDHPATEDVYFYEPKRNLIFIIKDTGDEMVLKTVFHPLLDDDMPVEYMRDGELYKEVREIKKALLDYPDGHPVRDKLARRRKDLLYEASTRQARQTP